MAKMTCIKCKKRYKKEELYFAEAKYTINRKNELHTINSYMCEKCAPDFLKEIHVAWNL